MHGEGKQISPHLPSVGFLLFPLKHLLPDPVRERIPDKMDLGSDLALHFLGSLPLGPTQFVCQVGLYP